MKTSFLPLALAFVSILPSKGAVFITEWMYSGNGDEFVEFTNLGSSAVDFTGWSFDDNNAVAGTFDLSAFGMVAPGESVILAQTDEASFRTDWGLAGSVKVIGLLGDTTGNNLGRNDAINLFDASNTLVDTLTYGDQDIAGSIRTQDVSGYTTPANYGSDDVLQWMLSVDGVDGAFTSTGGDVGSPGFALVPEPSSVLLIGLGSLGLLRRRVHR
ncbi:lamin tail domain-containing protein [Haloferula sargassicola]